MSTYDHTLFDTNKHVLDRDFVRDTLLSFPDVRRRAPILAMLMGMAGMQKETRNEKFEWRDAELLPRATAVNNGGTAYDATTTSIVVDDGTIMPARSVVRCEATGEVLLVTAQSGNTLTVVRGVGASNGGIAAAAGSLADNAALTFIGFANGEGATAGPNQSHPLNDGWNYIQEFSRTVEVSARALAAAVKTEDAHMLERKLMFEELMDDIESGIMDGARDVKTGESSKRTTTTHGLTNAITTNVINPAGTMNLDYFEDSVLRPIFESGGSGERHIFAGNTVLKTIDSILYGQTRRDPNEPSRRFVDTHKTRYGLVHVHQSLKLKGSRAGQALILDLNDFVKLRHMPQAAAGKRPAYDGLPTLHENIGSNDARAAKDEWCCAIGLQWGSESVHGRLLGVTGPA